jgi:hypothetical protein
MLQLPTEVWKIQQFNSDLRPSVSFRLFPLASESETASNSYVIDARGCGASHLKIAHQIVIRITLLPWLLAQSP